MISFNLKIAAIVVILLLAVGGVVWFAFFRTTTELISTAPTEVDFGTADERGAEAGGTPSDTSAANEPLEPAEDTRSEKIFQLADGPIAGAILIQTTRPTTTLVRFAKADNGRVFDLPLDVPGAVPRTVSNTTIPGLVRTLWLPNGVGMLAQYESDGVRKTVFIGLMSASTTLSASANPQPTRIQYLPDNIVDLALSPDGKSVAYLLGTQSGADGYTAGFDGSASKKLFSVPISQILLSWPAQEKLLITTQAVDGVLGAVFSVDVKTGAVSTLFFANAVSAIANRSLSQIVYHTILQDGVRSSFIHEIARNATQGLSFSPIPEKCIWSTASTTLYCATPLQFVPQNYLDFWHMGLGSASDSLISYEMPSGKSLIITTPGVDGGVSSDMMELSVSPDNYYLSFVNKSDRSLWGIRLR